MIDNKNFTSNTTHDMFEYSTSYSGYKLAHLISEFRNLEYLNIDCIKSIPFLYEYSLCSQLNNNSCIDDNINDIRVLKSIVEEIYENEYYEFVKEFNEYMEYHEVYDS